jgi:hypothetical protein
MELRSLSVLHPYPVAVSRNHRSFRDHSIYIQCSSSCQNMRSCTHNRSSKSRVCNILRFKLMPASAQRLSLVFYPTSLVTFAKASTVQPSQSHTSHSAEPISLPTSKRLSGLVFPSRSHLFLCVGYGCRVGAAFLTKAWPVRL